MADLPPCRCPFCDDTGETVVFYSGGEEPEFAPCDCSTGLLLECRITEQLTALWAAHPITEDDRG